MSAEVTMIETVNAHNYQDAFFSNSKNKSGFVACLAARMRKDVHSVSINDGDADTHIGSVAIEYARNGQSAVLVEGYTCIFILMLHHWLETMAYYRRSQGMAFS